MAHRVKAKGTKNQSKILESEFDRNRRDIEFDNIDHKQIEIREKNDNLNQYLFNDHSPNSDEMINYKNDVENAIKMLDEYIKQEDIDLSQMSELNSIFVKSLPTRMIWSAIYASKDPKDELTKWGKVIRDLTVIQSLQPASSSDKRKNISSVVGTKESFHDILADDKDDWMDSDWTEITQKDLNSKFIDSSSSLPEIKEKITPLLNKKFELKKEEIDLTINHYFDNFNGKKQSASKIDYFISILNDSKALSTKIIEEKESTQRLLSRLSELDSEISTLLVNKIGNTISLECEFVDEKVNLLKEKSHNYLIQSKIIMNSIDSITYGEKVNAVVTRIRDLLVRKITDNKKEKERLAKETSEYQANRIHLIPLVHQYSEIMKKSREIDRQVAQLMKI